MGESILTAQNLSKVVPSAEGELTILHPLSLELNKGDSLAIVGASGSGKSTLLGLLAACSPALNWRSISLADAPLSLELPCKPDYAVRDVDWGAGKQQLSMAGCQADGATWAVSHVLLAQPQEAPAVLTRWQQALQNQLQLPPDTPAGVVFLLKGALELPQAVQVQWQGRDAQGAPVVADARWWARLEGTGVRVYQAIVLSPRQPVAVAARDTFVQGLQLR